MVWIIGAVAVDIRSRVPCPILVRRPVSKIVTTGHIILVRTTRDESR